MNWQSYSAMCIAKGIENPYENEAHYNRAYGIAETEAPLVIRPKHKESITAHCKVVNAIRETRSKRGKEKREAAKKSEPKPKKPKAVKEPRTIMTPEEARLRRNERQRMYSAAKREEMCKPKKRRLSDEEKRAYKREYMKKWRALHPRASYEATMKWRRENPEKNRKRRREEKARARERKLTQLKGNNGTA